MSGYGAKGQELILRRQVKRLLLRDMPCWVAAHVEKTLHRANFRVANAKTLEHKRLCQARHMDEIICLVDVLYAWQNRSSEATTDVTP